jgi:hypothetical protein
MGDGESTRWAGAAGAFAATAASIFGQTPAA